MTAIDLGREIVALNQDSPVLTFDSSIRRIACDAVWCERVRQRCEHSRRRPPRLHLDPAAARRSGAISRQDPRG
jgi:hypothetical protein